MSTPGKGGKHAFLTLRADLLWRNLSDLKDGPGGSLFSGTWLAESPLDGQQMQQASDWLGDFLPTRSTDANRLRGERRQKERQEASTFLAYLRHQRDWLRAIERARAPTSSVDDNRSSSGSQETLALEIVDGMLVAVEEAIHKSGECPEEWDSVRDSLVTARRWRKSAGGAVQKKSPGGVP